MYKKVLLTGGSGFLGRQIIPICKENYKVLAPRSKTFDLYDYDKTLSYLKKHKPDIIIHGAAYYGGININVEEPANLFHHNTLMTTNLFEAAAKTKVKKIISVGSACAYPGNIVGDMKEEDFWSGPMHDSVIGYGSSKKIQLIAQQSYHKQYGLEGNHLALTNLYGEHDVFNEYRSHVVPALIKRFSDERENRSITNWGDGSAIREFIYVKDAARAICEFIEQDHDLTPVNIGTGVGTSIKQLAELTATYMNYHGKLEWDTTKPNGVPRKVLDISRMRRKIPNFKPIGFELGLKVTIDWYLENKKEADARK
jgi:GDP-L-fucose synthase